MERLHVRPDHQDDLAKAASSAAATLARGGVVGLPTETIYGLAALAASTDGREHLRKRSKRPAGTPSTWHAASAEAVQDALALTEPLHRRAVSKLLPGPVLLEIEFGVIGSGRWPMAGLASGVADGANHLRVRAPSHPVARAVLAAAGGPVIVDRVPASAGDGHDEPRADAESDPDLSILAGPTMHRAPSSVVRLWGRGAEAQYMVVTEGAASARTIQRRITRRVLFVCTGNTCRSPMAEAIARARIAEASGRPGGSVLGGIPTEVASGGVAASEGEPASPQTEDALRSVGVTPVSHRAKLVTPPEARDAEVIYTMSASHARALAAMGPEIAAKVRLLDPAGRDIPDPVGGPVALYISTARRLDEMIRARLSELASGGTA